MGVHVACDPGQTYGQCHADPDHPGAERTQSEDEHLRVSLAHRPYPEQA
jgi:hypothetical protein